MLKDLRHISHRCLEQLFEVLILRQVLIAGLDPLCNGFAVIDQNMIERVHEKDPVRLNAAAVQQHWLRYRFTIDACSGGIFSRSTSGGPLNEYA